MITKSRTGSYRIALTHRRTKMLYLDDQHFAWLTTKDIGDILVASHRDQDIEVMLGTGHYCMYQVEDEPQLTDVWHLELQYGQTTWQGYLLPAGLPDAINPRRRIIPTHQIITGNAEYRSNFILHRRRSFIPLFPAPDTTDGSPAEYTHSFSFVQRLAHHFGGWEKSIRRGGTQ